MIASQHWPRGEGQPGELVGLGLALDLHTLVTPPPFSKENVRQA